MKIDKKAMMEVLHREPEFSDMFSVVSRENPDPDRCWSDVILNHDAGTARLLAFQPGTGILQPLFLLHGLQPLLDLQRLNKRR
jgi:hypothetical protein